MFKEIKDKAHDEYFMQMHSFWFCVVLLIFFLGGRGGFFSSKHEGESLRLKPEPLIKMRNRGWEKSWGSYVVSESLSLWNYSRVKSFSVEPQDSKGIHCVWGFCKEMAKEGYIKDAFVCKHPLVERTLSELQIY